jgi:hypothetical protein
VDQRHIIIVFLSAILANKPEKPYYEAIDVFDHACHGVNGFRVKTVAKWKLLYAQPPS